MARPTGLIYDVNETPPPAVLGFGISTPAHVKQAIDAGAAGAISGSAIVERLQRGEPVEAFMREMRQNLPLRQ